MRHKHNIIDSTPVSTSYTEAFSIGAAAGFLHALAEVTVLGLAGVDFSVADALLLGVFYLSSVGAGCAFAWVMLSTVNRAINGRQLRMHRVIALLTTVGLNGIYVFLLPHDFRIPFAFIGIAASALALTLAWNSVAQSAIKAFVFLATSSSLCALLEISISMNNINPAFLFYFLIAVTLPALAAFCCLRIALGTPRKSERLGQFWSLVGCGIGIIALAGSAAALPLTLDWEEPSLKATVGGEEATRPNIVLIVLDTLRADHMELFGYERPTMPFLSEWARNEAFLVRSVTATSSWTLPSHASMFSGMYPYSHGAHRPFLTDDEGGAFAYELREDAQTLAEFLAELGYHTAGISANGFPLSFGLDRGFSYVYLPKSKVSRAASSVWTYRFRLGFGNPSVAAILFRLVPSEFSEYFNVFTRWEPGYARASVMRESLDAWIKAGASQPFFLFANFMDCHEPYVPLPEDRGVFAPPREGLRWTGGYPYRLLRSIAREGGQFTQHELDYLEGSYDEEMLALDRELSSFFQTLRAEGVYEKSMIVVTSDHGEAFFEHGMMRHGRTLYEEEVSVPLIVKLPDGMEVDPPQVGNHMQFVDFLPTVAEVLGESARLPRGLDGVPWGRGREFALSELYCPACGEEGAQPEGRIDALLRELAAVVVGPLKTIRSAPSGVEEVFDVGNDPSERRDLWEGRYNGIREPRAAKVFQVRQERTYRAVSGEELEPSMIDKLRGLGYIQ